MPSIIPDDSMAILAAVSADLARVFQITGLDRMFPIEPTVRRALELLNPQEEPLS
jgi:anti-anti-sigma regulatory factor